MTYTQRHDEVPTVRRTPGGIKNQLVRWEKYQLSTICGGKKGMAQSAFNRSVRAHEASLDVTVLAHNGSDIVEVDSPVGIIVCVTCAKPCVWDDNTCHAGHWLAAGSSARPHRYHRQNVHPQCACCNEHHSGRPKRYTEWMEQAHGERVMKEIKRAKEMPALTRPEIAELTLRCRDEIAYYETVIKEHTR